MNSLSFGEIIWDCYEGGRTIGGAPLNAVSHLVRLGSSGAIISAVGNDILGRESLEALKGEGVDTSLIGFSRYETGRADIILENGKADYSFNCPSAWDDICITSSSIEEIKRKDWDVFIFGTLSQRSSQSRNSLYEILDNVFFKTVFLDLNFRKNFYSRSIVERSLGYADILKMSDEEELVISSLLSLDGKNIVSYLFEKYDLTYIIKTCGKDGSILYSRNGEKHYDAYPSLVVDTVGAGDSFSSAFLYFYTQTADADLAARKAGILSSFVCSFKGALPEYTEELRNKLKIV